MNINAEPGHKVIYSAIRASRSPGRHVADGLLVPGSVYTVQRMEVYDFRADVYLEEMPGIKFDSLLFDDKL